MKKTIFFLALIGVFSCASPKYFQDYDRQADFSTYKTYAFYTEMDTGLSDLDEDRLLAAIDSVLQGKGLEKSTNPDFKINFYADYFETPSRNSLGIGIGGGGGNVGVGVSGGIPIGGIKSYLNLTLEFIEHPSNVLFWQGVAEARFNPNMAPGQRSAYFHTLAAGVLENYPPGE